jgi:hypothetical protein
MRRNVDFNTSTIEFLEVKICSKTKNVELRYHNSKRWFCLSFNVSMNLKLIINLVNTHD